MEELQLQRGILLQYMDDLITGLTYEDSLGITIRTFNHLADCSYKVSASKAQVCKLAIKFLGFLQGLGKEV